MREASSQASFQSPCGVLGVCRAQGIPATVLTAGKFQSPCGVLGVCRLLALCYVVSEDGVSVPLRGFRGLQGVLALRTPNSCSTSFSPLAGF